jgi:meso-butanediol dehydrogenase/(S,S)-butanediol dehydrogenase/diacetyl reductase
MSAAIVTGATRGIGRACAELLLNLGWGVVGVGRDQPALDALAAEFPGRALGLAGDVSHREVNLAAVRAAIEHFGGVTAVIGNAGTTIAKLIDETTNADFDRIVNVNLRSLVHLAQAAHAPLAASRGSFVIVASNKGLVGQRGSPLYCATKGAAVQLSRALALDWASEGIRVNAVCPGVVDTGMLDCFLAAQADPSRARHETATSQPLGRLASPADCAEIVAFLVSPAAAYVTGVAFPVDGGFTAQ